MMKRLWFFFATFILALSAYAQKDIQIRNLWAEPEVHVLFNEYKISFTIRDINRALELLAENGITTYGNTSGLDTTKQYAVELYAGYRQELHNELEPMIQL